MRPRWPLWRQLYAHPRLAAVDLKADIGVTSYDVSDEPLSADEWTAQVSGRPH